MAENQSDWSMRMEKHFTKNAQSSFRRAQQIATEMDGSYLNTNHLLLGILAQKASRGCQILEQEAKVEFENFYQVVLSKSLKKKTAVKKAASGSFRRPSVPTAKVLEISYQYAREFNQPLSGTSHIVFSILNHSCSEAVKTLQELRVNIEKLKFKIRVIIKQQTPDSPFLDFLKSIESSDSDLIGQINQMYNRMNRQDDYSSRLKKRTGSNLTKFVSDDLTKLALQGKLDPVIGRQEQIKRMITILNRRLKNNPVLIGEPGVGKTAIVEGLAQRIATEDVPQTLLDKKIVVLDLASMVAGSKYRGEFEERFKNLLTSLTRRRKKDTIIFIDEIHLLIGAGAAEGAIDASNMLKPALARGHFQIIGATTTFEYEKYIEKDAALERRLQPIVVPPTTKGETLAILRGLSPTYEDYHQVQITDEILEKVIQLSDRYINDRYMPDKAIDLLDESAAYLRVLRDKVNPHKRILQKQIQDLKKQVRSLAEEEKYHQTATKSDKVIELENELKALNERLNRRTRPVLGVNHLSEVISNWTQIPIKQVINTEAKSLLKLEKQIGKKIIGQKQAIEAVASAIRRSRSGVGNPHRPIGSFLFLGPTGVGKTELARVLATEFYGKSDSLIKLDMSEFSARFTVSRLIGSPPGYINSDKPGQLTGKVRRQPYSLVLFDEIEKAHPEVFQLLLQILEDGTLTDSSGRVVNFRSTIIILTSNIGAKQLQGVNLGFVEDDSTGGSLNQDDASKAKITKSLKNFMKPELINRFDKMVVFKHLTRDEIAKIVEIQLKNLKQRLLEQKISLIISPAIKRWLAKEGWSRKNGARPLRRLIQVQLENKIADFILVEKIKGPNILRLNLKKDKVIVSLVEEEN